MGAVPGKSRSGGSGPPWERLGELEEYRLLCRARLEHAVPVREPLVLVSQVERSGGTLLSQLFDGHPECHAHPQELHIGYPKKRHWPPLDLGRPETWFGILYEKAPGKHLESGYRKSPSPGGVDVFPFLFSPRLQREIFAACVAERAIERERDVLDCYFTSYFNAWLDNHNLYTGPKQVVTGFTPQLVLDLANVERYLEAYPDGTLVSIVRDPRAWYSSAREHRPARHAIPDESLRLWCRSARAALDAAERFAGHVLVVVYERLVTETESVMGRLSGRLGIAMSAELLTPTFNCRPIRADSSYEVHEHGVLPDRVDAYRGRLDSSTIARIDELAGDLYERACDAAGA